MRACLALFAAAVLAACGDDAARPPTPTHATTLTPPTKAPAPPTKVPPLDDLADIDDTPEPVPPTGTPDIAPLLVDTAAPARGCVAITATPMRIWPRGGPAAVTAVPTGFVVAGYAPGEQGGEEVFVVRVPSGHAPSPLARFPLGPAAAAGMRDAPPAVADRGMAQIVVALADGHGSVRASALSLTTPTMLPPLSTIAAGADLRFAPAIVVAHGLVSIAFTDGRATPMRVRLATLRDDLGVATTRDLTPPAMGASAPFAFADDAPSVVFLDAHGGLSPILRVPLAEDGTPSAAIVERPLSTVSEPAHIAVATAVGATWVGYTAVGRAATSAVGLVRLGSEGPPVAIVPGTGYGRLHLAAVSASHTAVFAADRPVTGAVATEAIKTDVVVRVLDDSGLGPPLTITDPASQRASHPALARAHDGTIALAFTAPSGVYLSLLRCAD